MNPDPKGIFWLFFFLLLLLFLYCFLYVSITWHVFNISSDISSVCFRKFFLGGVGVLGGLWVSF